MPSSTYTVCSPTSRVLPTSTDGTQYGLMIVDDATNMDWPVFSPDKSAVMVSCGYRAFLAVVSTYAKPAGLGSDNVLKFINKEFQTLTSDKNIHREYVSVDGPKRNRRVGLRLALVAEGGVVMFLEFHVMLDGVTIPAKALDFGRTWPEALTWMCDALNIMARADEKPGMMCSFEKSYGRAYRRAVLPNMMPRHHEVKRAVKSEPKGESCFYISSGNEIRIGLLQDHATAVRRRELLDRCGLGLPTCAHREGVDHGQRG